MKVKDLISELQKMPQEAIVWHLWDGALRTQINIVYESKTGDVVTSDYDMVCYDFSNEDRPVGTQTNEEDSYWSTPKSPNDQ